LVLAVGALAFLLVRIAEPGSSDEPPPARRSAEPVVDQKAFDTEARQVAGKFILTAVARKNTGASWELLDPTYAGREGFTKQTWAKGEIPVIPFPGAEQADARFNVTYSSPAQLMVEVAGVAREGRPGGLRSRSQAAKTTAGSSTTG
jgi:hypothetical protein